MKAQTIAFIREATADPDSKHAPSSALPPITAIDDELDDIFDTDTTVTSVDIEVTNVTDVTIEVTFGNTVVGGVRPRDTVTDPNPVPMPAAGQCAPRDSTRS